MVAVPKAAPHPVLPAAQETMPVVGTMQGVMFEGPPNTTVVAEETDRELSLVLTPGGSHPPMRDEPLLRWGSPQDPSSVIFTLDDGTEDMDRESLGNGITAVLDALNHAQGTF